MSPRRPRLRARSLAVVLTTLATVAAACGTTDTGSDAGPAAVTDATTAPFTPGTSPATDTRPILELIDVCYGACSPVAAGGLPTVAVYPDGTIVRSGYTSAAGDTQATLAAYQGRLDADALARLVDEARAAELTLGGEGVNGSAAGLTEGGGTRFVARLDGTETAFEVPLLTATGDEVAATGTADGQFGGDQTGDQTGGDPAQRASLAALATDLRQLATQAATEPRRGARWVVLAAPATDGGVNASWSSPDPASWAVPPGLVAEAPALGATTGTALRCGLLDVGDGRVDELASASRGWLQVRDGGVLWALAARPLLPHEHNCTDVARSVADQRLVELADLRGR